MGFNAAKALNSQVSLWHFFFVRNISSLFYHLQVKIYL